MKKNRCHGWKLYVITDRAALKNKSLDDAVSQAISGGASVIQLRDKQASDQELMDQARKVLAVTRSRGVPLIINDRIKVAKMVGADGVHLGQEDASLEMARLDLGLDAIVGRSTHSPEQALRAEAEGFDYIGVGPVFATPTKPSYTPVGLDLVRFAAKNIQIPFVAIGGIDASNVAEVIKAGAQTVAVVRAVMAAENCALSAKQICENMRGN